MVTSKHIEVLAALACTPHYVENFPGFDKYVTYFVFPNQPDQAMVLNKCFDRKLLTFTDVVDSLPLESKRELIKQVLDHQYFSFVPQAPTVRMSSHGFAERIAKYLLELGVSVEVEYNCLRVPAEEKKKWMGVANDHTHTS